MPKDTTTYSEFGLAQSLYPNEATVLAGLRDSAALTRQDRAQIAQSAADLVRRVRGQARPGMMEAFLAEYGLDTEEGVALMRLAEALLRVPDGPTRDALIADKIAPGNWRGHRGKGPTYLVNSATEALSITRQVLSDHRGPLARAARRLGTPVIRHATHAAMQAMGGQFVLGEDITRAMARARKEEARGLTYSYDMLGEAARTMDAADAFFDAYSNAIAEIAKNTDHGSDIRDRPGISIKLSALWPRYDLLQAGQAHPALVDRLGRLARQAAQAGIGLNVDAEEADRLDLSLEIIDAVLADPALDGWDGFGVVVQAYGLRAADAIGWLHDAAGRHGKRLMVRLVKGAYWDAEIKRAQVLGAPGFPVFTRKAASDISYIACARLLFDRADRLYPQFATHNAHTVEAVLHIARQSGAGMDDFEFQRLHGMGAALHAETRARHGNRCRIYAPVGAHDALLPYLVRRLLENGANSSFVNQIADESISPEAVSADPFEADTQCTLTAGPDLFAPARRNAQGFDLHDIPAQTALMHARARWQDAQWQAGPVLATDAPAGAQRAVVNPANPDDIVGHVAEAMPDHVALAMQHARIWDADVAARANALRAAADRLEDQAPEIFACLAREAGKTAQDAVAELREAVDFLRYYAAEAEARAPMVPRGTFAAIAPWNFPLAIFCGQIAAALATGNAVVAKPAPQTPLMAQMAIAAFHGAGVPRTALQCLPGGADVGAALTAHPGLDGVAFTGSTATAQAIHRSVADNAGPGVPLIAETGGLNAMIVDSTALPEQVVEAVIESAFQSAGQRCSALRCLYVQEDIADDLIAMLQGAMDMLNAGDPWDLSCDIGPVIDADAKARIADHIAAARADGRLLYEAPCNGPGHFVAPALVAVSGIADLKEEVFGPVLHVARFKAQELDRVIADVNATGYGLTFGLHTRLDGRARAVAEAVAAGNVYVNRNQIGAIVGSQPFGGMGLSGTGPKAGGPLYLPRFAAPAEDPDTHTALARAVREGQTLPGPTGEDNAYRALPGAPLLCLGPGAEAAAAQKAAVEALGGEARIMSDGIAPDALTGMDGIGGALWWGDAETGRILRRALAARSGPILPLITGQPDSGHALKERHVSTDTTAAGGNATLLAQGG